MAPRGVLAGAWPPRGVRALASVGHGRGERARHGAGWAGSVSWAECEAAAQQGKNEIFFKLFSIPFAFKRIFELIQSSFKLWPKNKSCSKIYSLYFAFKTKVKFQIDFELQN